MRIHIKARPGEVDREALAEALRVLTKGAADAEPADLLIPAMREGAARGREIVEHIRRVALQHMDEIIGV
jgi:hypothetical protein